MPQAHEERDPGHTVAVYPGSFDPPTRGHIDLIERAQGIFGRLVVAVGVNGSKTGTFSADERIAMLTELLAEHDSIEVTSFEGLLVDWCRARGLGPVVRGVRNATDFDYERTMSMQNRALAPEIDTVFLMPSHEFAFTSSSLIREIVAAGGDASPWLHASVLTRLSEKLRR